MCEKGKMRPFKTTIILGKGGIKENVGGMNIIKYVISTFVSVTVYSTIII
jgi:hypothetical protein